MIRIKTVIYYIHGSTTFHLNTYKTLRWPTTSSWENPSRLLKDWKWKFYQKMITHRSRHYRWVVASDVIVTGIGSPRESGKMTKHNPSTTSTALNSLTIFLPQRSRGIERSVNQSYFTEGGEFYCDFGARQTKHTSWILSNLQVSIYGLRFNRFAGNAVQRTDRDFISDEANTPSI